MKRHETPAVRIGKVQIGKKCPIAIQSMTNTDTADVEATAKQILELCEAGAAIVRITVNNETAAKSVPRIMEAVRKQSDVPIVGDFHFNGNVLLERFPDCAKSLDKYRINPGNADQKNFRETMETALKYEKPVRIGVNTGSLDRKILDQLMAQNAKRRVPESAEKILQMAAVESALASAKSAESLGLPKNKIVLSAKMSSVSATIAVYEALAKKSNYCLHLGLTEAGSGEQGVVQSAIALGTLLGQGIGDTIRVSLTPGRSTPRTREIEVCKHILQSLDLQNFAPRIISCPGCGRTSNEYFQNLVELLNIKIVQKMEVWKKNFPEVVHLRIAIMGCVVNGPGESRQADIGISLPGRSESPIASVFVKGKHFCDLKGKNLDEQFLNILEDFMKQKNGYKN